MVEWGILEKAGFRLQQNPALLGVRVQPLTLTAASLWELSALSFHYVHDYFSQYSLEQPLIQISPGTE